MTPRLIVEQKITAFVNQYSMYATDGEGNKSELVAFAQQKRVALKEKILFYTDTQKSSVVFTLRAEKVLDVRGRYLVEDASGKLIGSFRKQFKQSLLNSTWTILRDDKPVVQISESSTALALLRRFGGVIPFVGGVIEIITMFLKYHFVYTDMASGELAGKYQKTTLLRDHYLFSMNDTVFTSQDWRLWAGMAVALDALQSR